MWVCNIKLIQKKVDPKLFSYYLLVGEQNVTHSSLVRKAKTSSQ